MSSNYESAKLLNEYLLFHYASRSEVLADFPAPGDGVDFPSRTVAPAVMKGGRRALDLGCAVGRSAFELTRTFDEVIGIDFSRAFIDAANRIKVDGRLEYEILVEGEISRRVLAEAPRGTRPGKVSFEPGDATRLRADLGSFDCVHAANLVCRLAEPMRLIERFKELVRTGGMLILATPFTWLEEFTPRVHWLGDAGTSGFDHLKVLLEPDFHLESQSDEPFLIRESARKYQMTFSCLSVWTRK